MNCDVGSNVSLWWQTYFHQNHLGINHFTLICLFSELIPTGTILLSTSWIMQHAFQKIRYSRRADHRRKFGKQTRITVWMSNILILHSSLFLMSLLSHIVSHFMTEHAHAAWWVLLAILISCSLNFYVYFLSGRAFRNEICRLFR